MKISLQSSQTAAKMSSVLHLAQACKYDAEHSKLVTQFATTIFDAMRPIHKLGATERTWLEMAGILHDIGWIDGRDGHHKATLKIILNSPILDLSNKERLIIGSIARYHRKSLPGLEHDHFAALEPVEQGVVVTLASLLRLADGLDHLGSQKIRNISAEAGKKSLLVTCKVISSFPDKPARIPKSDLFEIVFRRHARAAWSLLL